MAEETKGRHIPAAALAAASTAKAVGLAAALRRRPPPAQPPPDRYSGRRPQSLSPTRPQVLKMQHPTDPGERQPDTRRTRREESKGKDGGRPRHLKQATPAKFSGASVVGPEGWKENL
jgi:hypothetical protein